MGCLGFCALAVVGVATACEIFTRSLGPEILATLAALWFLWKLSKEFRCEEPEQVLVARFEWVEPRSVQRQAVCVSEAILWNSKALDHIAAQRGSPALSSFVSRPRE
jgi:hypothetical protein